MSGLVLMMIAAAAFSLTADAVGDGAGLLTSAPPYVSPLAVAWLVAAHVAAIGLIVLLAGLKGVPLLTSAKARRGAWQKLMGFTLIILCFAYTGLMDLPAFKFVDEIWWISFPGLLVLLLMAHTGCRLLRTGWKYDALPAENVLAADLRAPVVYLRSFEADSEIAIRPAGFWNKVMNLLIGYMMAFSPEQELAEVLNRVGPVIAIGKPGEPLPELGAARLYVGDDQWKTKVTEMLARASLVIIRTGSTPNLQWEIEQTLARVPRRQILFVTFGDQKKRTPFDQYFEQRFGPPAPALSPAGTPVWIKLLSIGKYVNGRIITFDESLQPREEPLRLKFSWAQLALGLMRPYRDSIQSAMRQVFSSLHLPWTTRHSQTVAVLLAMCGGIFGLHHFYLGDRRRGWKHAAFFWTTVPMCMGLYDTVKLAWLEAAEFDAKYGARQQHTAQIDA